jgi:S1-C subfamily serine protease
MKRGVVLVMLALTVLMGCSREKESRPSSGGTADFTAIVRAVRPSVVNISAVAVTGGPFPDLLYRFFGQDPPREFAGRRFGSGVVVGKKGYVLTSNHVVDGVESIKVTVAGGRSWPGEVVRSDARRDLAVIRVVGGEGLVPAPLGKSSDLEVGDWVVAVGNPFGLENTVTVGVVSAMERKGVTEDVRVGLIQTDASINPGNDGGPLVNARGEVVGINNAVSSEAQGIGFAVPIDDARGLVREYL